MRKFNWKLILTLVFCIFVFGAIMNPVSANISPSEEFHANTDSLAIQNDISYENGQIISESDSLDEAYLTYTTEDHASILGDITDNSINPQADELKRSKTITKFYTDFNQIPDNTHYREYYDGHWYGGFLFLTKAKKVTGGWEATFSGYIYAYVE